MFTGLVEALGTVTALEEIPFGRRLTIRHSFGPLEMGESIAVEGACLTVMAQAEGEFSAELSSETLACTTLSELLLDSSVNLERSLRANSRLGGHFVSGHVDGVGQIRSLLREGAMTRVSLWIDASLRRFVAKKGSVAISGVSLTVNEVREEELELLLIPHTQAVTTAGAWQVGTKVNIEVDLLARYVERLLEKPA